MHEMGVVLELVQIAVECARANKAEKVTKLVLQIGEASAVIPEAVRVCYPAAVENTLLEGSELEIEILPANAVCVKCGKVFNLAKEKFYCPSCRSRLWDLLGGKDVLIKEIEVKGVA